MSNQLHSVCLTTRMLSFLECQRVCCKESTIGSYKISLKHFCLFLQSRNKLNQQDLKTLTANELTDFLMELSGQDLVPYTKVNYLLSIRLYLVWEAEDKNIDPDILKVLDRSKLPKIPEYLPRPLSCENDRLLQARLQKSNSPYALLFLLLRQTGLRISELINLPYNPIVTNDKNQAFLKVPLGKMNNERMLPLSQETLELISKIKKAYPIALNKCDKNRLMGFKGTISSVRNHLDYHFSAFVEGITDQNKPITFHRLRHTYATSLLSGGVSIVSIMKLLGHRRIEMSLRYAKVTPSHLRDEYLKAIAVIENQTGIQATNSTSITEYHPAKIMDYLMAYLKQSAKITPVQKKNVIRKMTRIKTDLNSFSYSQSFKMARLNAQNK